MSNLQINKLKSTTKNSTQVTLNLSLNVINDSNDKTNFRHQLLLINSQVSKICKTFANGSTAGKKLLKSQMSKITQFGAFVSFLAFMLNLDKILDKNRRNNNRE